MEKQWISIWIAFGRARFGRGDISGAREAFAHARQTSEAIRDEDSLSLLMMNEAQLLETRSSGRPEKSARNRHSRKQNWRPQCYLRRRQ